MEQNWTAVAEALRTSRQAMGLTQEELAARAETSRSTIQLLEGGHHRRRVSRKMLEVAELLGWPDGHLDKLLAGEVTGPPAHRKGAATGTPAPRADLPLAVARELGLGDLLDTRVVELDGADARMIVVVRAADGATPEQIEQALAQWRRVQQNLQMGETHAG
jgi:transcriptional regulator with XRE-family HTH domain